MNYGIITNSDVLTTTPKHANPEASHLLTNCTSCLEIGSGFDRMLIDRRNSTTYQGGECWSLGYLLRWWMSLPHPGSCIRRTCYRQYPPYEGLVAPACQSCACAVAADSWSKRESLSSYHAVPGSPAGPVLGRCQTPLRQRTTTAPEWNRSVLVVLI